jgi:glycosyltransferase involved in cell wall biosynthesis
MPLTHQIAFSAVIPTYNRAQLVGRAITSALNQSFPPAEILVVDDGSTDETEAVVRRFGSVVRYISQKNSGGAEARNRGVREATQEWVAFLDSDDVWTVLHLESIAGAIGATEGAAVIYFDDMLVADSPRTTWWEKGGFDIRADHVMVPDASEWVLREYQPMMLQSTICRRSTFLEEGGLWADLRNAHDTHFFLKIGIGKPFCAVRGIGSRLTADAPEGGRLTSAGLQQRRYLNKILAFRDILEKKTELSYQQRKCLRERLAASLWTLGRYAWEDRQYARFGIFAMQALLAEPGATLRLATGALHRYKTSTPISTPPAPVVPEQTDRTKR